MVFLIIHYLMNIIKKDKNWTITIDEGRVRLGFLGIIRFLEFLNGELLKASKKDRKGLHFYLDLKYLLEINSSVVAYFIILQMTLTTTDGVLHIINVQSPLKNALDVVMLDTILHVDYLEKEPENYEESLVR